MIKVCQLHLEKEKEKEKKEDEKTDTTRKNEEVQERGINQRQRGRKKRISMLGKYLKYEEKATMNREINK